MFTDSSDYIADRHICRTTTGLLLKEINQWSKNCTMYCGKNNCTLSNKNDTCKCRYSKCHVLEFLCRKKMHQHQHYSLYRMCRYIELILTDLCILTLAKN